MREFNQFPVQTKDFRKELCKDLEIKKKLPRERNMEKESSQAHIPVGS